MSRIASIRGREVLDSRGRPTVECDVALDDGSLGRASVPSGTSTGLHEAHELRDHDQARYSGLGVRGAVRNIEERIEPALSGQDAFDQAGLDSMMIEIDGTVNRASLGANAILAVSISIARAAANSLKVPLYVYIRDLIDEPNPSLPLPRFNMISGGAHANGTLDIQDVMMVPTGAPAYSAALEDATKVHGAIANRMRAIGHPLLAAVEGGWAPSLASNETAISWVAEAIQTADVDGAIALDVAASQFYDAKADLYRLAVDGREVSAAELVEMLEEWVSLFPIVSLEDPLAEDQWSAWSHLTETLGATVEIVGDDLFATDLDRLKRGTEEGAGNAILIKPNQVGTLTETLEAIEYAKRSGFATIVSARSGDTEDPFVADLAVGSGAGQIKVGSTTGSSRTAKWNQLLRIEEELGRSHYAGQAALLQAANHPSWS